MVNPEGEGGVTDVFMFYCGMTVIPELMIVCLSLFYKAISSNTPITVKATIVNLLNLQGNSTVLINTGGGVFNSIFLLVSDYKSILNGLSYFEVFSFA